MSADLLPLGTTVSTSGPALSFAPPRSAEHARRRLQFVERLLAKITTAAGRLEGERDSLIRQLTDLDGAHDRRAVGVR